MYLEHFAIQKFPFTLTPNTEFFCDLPGHQAAFNVLLYGLHSGEGFIKITGEVGSGKTLLCRKLLDSLEDKFYTAYIPNPDLSPIDLKFAFARELGLKVSHKLDQGELLQLIFDKLLEFHAKGKQAVLIIDEAQALPNESLEALRLLTNLETQSEKLLQIVLFGQPELDERLRRNEFRQLNQRITFSHTLNSLNRDNLNAYLCHRLAIAGYTKGSIFDRKAQKMLFKASQGIPRVVNILCHKSMLSAYGKGDKFVNREAMKLAIKDSKEMVSKSEGKFKILKMTIAAALVLSAGALVALKILVT